MTQAQLFMKKKNETTPRVKMIQILTRDLIKRFLMKYAVALK